MDKYKRHETLFYVVIWALVFALVPLVMGLHTVSGHDHSMNFGEVLGTWGRIVPFLIVFLVHNFVILRLAQGRLALQIALVVLLMGGFSFYCLSSWQRPPGAGLPEPGNAPGMAQMAPGDIPAGPPPRGKAFRAPPPDGERPVTPEVMKIIMGFLVIAANMGARAYFNNLRDSQRLKDLQTENLSQRLEALRYQINPHFFMNTLNNIHALVDIDPDKAKESIEEFSKAMRVVLYEGSEPTIPLAREIEFIGHFISLMRLRYPQSVRIDVSFPEQDVPASVPPLLMASFVENAFKHGISYEQESFVRVSLAQERDKVVFKCVNSRHPDQGRVRHGLGLENIRKRLDLLYGGTYVLQVDETSGVYDILLVLPMEPPYPAKSLQP